MIKHMMEQSSEAWHEIRLGRFTGTRIKNLMSAKSTLSYKDTITDVAVEILTGVKDESYTNEIMQRGIDLEPEARGHYEQLFECKVDEVGFIEPDESNYSDWAGISPDGLVGDHGMIEIKCPKAKTLFKYIKSGKLPTEYRWQVQSQLWITGRDWCDFMAYYPGLKPFILRVYPDQDDFEKIYHELNVAIHEVKKAIKEYKQYDYLNE